MLLLKAKTVKVLKYGAPPVVIIGIIAGVWYMQRTKQQNEQYEFAQALTAANIELNQLQVTPAYYESDKGWEIRSDLRSEAWGFAGLS